MLKEFLLTEDKNKGSVRVLEVLEVSEVLVFVLMSRGREFIEEKVLYL
jgi:hypothetical protein